MHSTWLSISAANIYTDGEQVKYLNEELPGVRVAVLFQDFLVKPVILGYLSRLVVAPQQGYFVWVHRLQAEQVLDSLHRIVAAVHKVPDEYIVFVRQLSALIKQFEHVEELSMDISTHVDWRANVLDIALFKKNILGRLAK
jgi:hypothetical protein